MGNRHSSGRIAVLQCENRDGLDYRTVECASFSVIGNKNRHQGQRRPGVDDQLCSIRPMLEAFRRPPALTHIVSPSDEDGTECSLESGSWSPNSTISSFSDCRGYYTSTRKPSEDTGRDTLASRVRRSSSSSSLADLLEYTPEELEMPETPLPVTDLSVPRRHVWIVTTAALPWMTGTAVNPLLRAAALCSAPYDHRVTLVQPWLERPEDRLALYGPDWEDATVERQETYLKEWLAHNGLEDAVRSLKFDFYPARYHVQLSSIFALGDLCERLETQVPPELRDEAVCLLEEPEHVNFYRALGVTRWRQVLRTWWESSTPTTRRTHSTGACWLGRSLAPSLRGWFRPTATRSSSCCTMLKIGL